MCKSSVEKLSKRNTGFIVHSRCEETDSRDTLATCRLQATDYFEKILFLDDKIEKLVFDLSVYGSVNTNTRK